MSLQYSRRAEDSESGKYKIVLDALPPAYRILEIGCSTGYFLEVLQNHGFLVHGCEFDRDAIEIAKAKGLNVTWGNAEEPSTVQIEEKVDAILLLDVLEHLRDPEKTLAYLGQVLNSQGRLLITVPNIAYWAVRKDLLLGRWKYVEAGILDKTHLRFNNLSGWSSLFETNKFKIKQVKVADAMIVGESRLRNIPGLNRFVDLIKNCLVRAFPNLFAISFFFELQPENQP